MKVRTRLTKLFTVVADTDCGVMWALCQVRRREKKKKKKEHTSDFLFWQLLWAPGKKKVHRRWKTTLKAIDYRRVERVTARDLCDLRLGFGFALRPDRSKLFQKLRGNVDAGLEV